MDNDELWRTFQASFLMKLNSADFAQTFEARRNTLTSTTSPLPPGRGRPPAGRGRTFQRRRSKTGEELREQVDKAAMPTPLTGEGEGFFMTQFRDASPSPTKLPLSTSSLPPPSEDDLLALTKKSNLLRNRMDTALHQASAELRKPIPGKYQDLKSLMDKLTHSPEERASFYQHISSLLVRRSSSSAFNIIYQNRASCGDGTARREEVMKRRERTYEERDRKIKDAKEKVEGLIIKRKEGMEAKVKRRELMKERELERLERVERARMWCEIVKMGDWVKRMKPAFESLKASRVAQSKEARLANKIIGLWSAKKAPSKGKKYRECVKKLRGFIQSKTKQWKRAQKQRAVDIMVLFLQEHRRANLPTVVRHFIGGVKTWQRWYREYRRTTEGRIKGMLVLWEEVEARWLEKEERRLREEAREKRRMEEEFDLDKVLSSMGGRIQRGPKYARAKGEKRDDIAPLESLKPTRVPSPTGQLMFDPRKHRSSSPVFSSSMPPASLTSSPLALMGGGGKEDEQRVEEKTKRIEPRPPKNKRRKNGKGNNNNNNNKDKKDNNNSTMNSPNARARKAVPKTPHVQGPRSSTSASKGKGVSSSARSMNISQTSLIITMRLKKDLHQLRTNKPSMSVKRNLLRAKLMECRLKYKMGMKGYAEMMSEGIQGEVKRKEDFKVTARKV
ncbi:hypothetical protein TrCOL_g12828 [Triparma columacea]|uniref:Uncharacterized protein n=1 Tax=Triparma columacea TaxID=722753 RepID=A0A9W7LGG8_9STRA|nr:hypothetical protein TrCOL_g12828 [Triparma columacea]